MQEVTLFPKPAVSERMRMPSTLRPAKYVQQLPVRNAPPRSPASRVKGERFVVETHSPRKTVHAKQECGVPMLDCPLKRALRVMWDCIVWVEANGNCCFVTVCRATIVHR